MLFASLSVASGIWLWILCDSFWCLTYCLQPEFFWRLWLCPDFCHTEHGMVLMQSDFLTAKVYPAGLFSVCKFSNACSEFPNSVVHRESELLSWLNTSLFGVAPHNCSNLPMTMSSCCSGSRRECFPAASPISADLTGWPSGSCMPPLPFHLLFHHLLILFFSLLTPSCKRENSSELLILKDGHCFSCFSLWTFLFYFVIKSEMFSAVTHLLW